MPASSGRRWLIPGIGAALVVSLGAFYASGGATQTPPREAAGQSTPVIVRAVGQVGRADYVGLSGDVEAVRTANIGFLVPGLVATVGPREGDFVREGQVIATLDPRDYELNVELATAQRERAEDEYQRARQVFDQKGIPENDFNKAATGMRMARAQEAMAKKKLADTRIVAPMSGVIARRGVEPGEQAGPGFPVFTIMQIQPVQVRIGVPEAQIGRIAVGQRTMITIPSLRNRSFEGRVRLVGIAADPASRTFLTKIEVANPGNVLKPGMIAEVRIHSNQRVEALTIPAEAVIRDANGVMRVFVYEPKEERVFARRVDIGSALGQEVEVRSGLKRGEMVVIGGQHRVREGGKVTARVEPAPTVSAAEVRR